MIYRVVLDDTIDLHTSDINCMLLNPSLDLEMNSAGSFNFTLPPSHPYWDAIKVLKSTIDVYEDGDLIFTGRIASIEKNWNNERVVQCEGALAYFNDSIHRQMKWETPLPIASEDPTVHNFLKDILDNHNVFEGAENANRHIFIGNITVDPEVVTREVNYDTTLDILTRMCIDTNGGYMSIRKDLDDGKLYLDWIKDFTEESGQPAQFGLNLLNFDTSLAAEDICTGVLARGAEVNEQTVMLNDVELVDETTYPDMSVTHYTTQYQDILWHREGVAKFGQVVQVHDFSDAQTAWKDGQGQIVANSLFEMAKKWLEEKNTKIETIEVEVAELAWLGEGMPKYKLGQIVELSDDVHMAGESYETRLLPMYKLSCDLNSGSKKVTLGTPPKKELTQISASNSDSSTLSSSGSSSGGGSGEGEECRVHDVKVNGTSVVTDKIANISVPTDTVTQSQMTQAINTAVSPKANTADVNQALAQKQDNLVFNSQDAATAHLTKIKNGNEVYDIPTGTEVEANPTGTATSDLTKLKVGNYIYGIPSGGTTVVANPSETATDDLNTIKIGDTVYDIPGDGSSTNYGKFKCDVLFVNDPLPSPTGGIGNVERTYTLGKSIDDYDAVYVVSRCYYASGSGSTNIVSRIIFKSEYYSTGFDGWGNWDGTSNNSVNRSITYTFTDDTHVKSLGCRTESGQEPVLYKIYGLKFENKLINRSDIYSEEERMIGRWTDGKPLYQKSWDFGSNVSIPSGNYYTGFNIDSSNIDKILFGEIANNDGTLYDNASYDPTRDNHTLLGIKPDNNCNVRYLTLQYTKLADQPGSGVIPEDPQMVMMSDYYSEEEQVVGRWTDGKPLYQKTFKSVTSQQVNDWTVFDNVNTFYDTLVNVIQKATFSNLDQVMANPDQNTTPRFAVRSDHKLYYYSDTSISTDITIQYTKTTDAPGTGPTKGNLIYLPALYSEEEREVGVWKDGKPIYQKNIPIPAIQSAQSGVLISNLGLNIDTCVDIKVRLYKDTAPDNDSVIATASFGDMYFYYRKSEDSIRMDAPFSWVVGRYGNITIQYTKTTDAPGSATWTPEGQLAHHYSTSEKIVGTWIDGSTVYERTWSGLSYSTSSGWTNFVTVPNGKNLIKANFYGEFGTDLYEIMAQESHIDSATGILEAWFQLGSTRTVKVITLQYTKSS